MIELTSGVSEAEYWGRWSAATYRGEPVSEYLLGHGPEDWTQSPSGQSARYVKSYWDEGHPMAHVQVRLSGAAYDPDSECFILGYDVSPEGDHFTYTTVVWSAKESRILLTMNGVTGTNWGPNGLKEARIKYPALIHLRYFS